MWGIFDKDTSMLDFDPEPMVFKKRDTALMVLQSGYAYGTQDQYLIRELTEEEEKVIPERWLQ